MGTVFLKAAFGSAEKFQALQKNDPDAFDSSFRLSITGSLLGAVIHNLALLVFLSSQVFNATSINDAVFVGFVSALFMAGQSIGHGFWCTSI